MLIRRSCSGARVVVFHGAGLLKEGLKNFLIHLRVGAIFLASFFYHKKNYTQTLMTPIIGQKHS